jgi:archaemetzincin
MGSFKTGILKSFREGILLVPVLLLIGVFINSLVYLDEWPEPYRDVGADASAPLVMGLLPMGGNAPLDLMDSLCDWLNAEWGLQLEWMAAIPVPGNIPMDEAEALNATELLRFLEMYRPRRLNYLMTFTDSDIFFPFSSNKKFVLGLAPVGGFVSVVSTARMRQALLPGESIFDRFLKVSIHELGHKFGLEHCNVSDICLMQQGLADLDRFDRAELYLCDVCRLPFMALLQPFPLRHHGDQRWSPIFRSR